MNATIHKHIVEFFDAHPQKGYTSRQLRRIFRLRSEAEFQELRRILHNMVDAKELIFTKKKGYHRKHAAQSFTGVLSLTKQGHGFVRPADMDEEEIFVDRKSMSTAMNGDTVEVALLPARRGTLAAGEGREGEIVGIVSRGHTEFVGTLERSKNFYFVLPDDNKVPRDIYIPPNALHHAKPGDKVVVKFESWDSEHLNPEGSIVSVLGKAGDPFAELESVIRSYHLPTKFPQEVEHAVSRLADTIPEEELSHRYDARPLTVFTIDPEDAKDFDDALSLEVVDETTVRVGVHIADVTAYVKEGTTLDAEAYKRGTSVYLANQVIPMLPEKLSNNLCSLVPHRDRLTYSCFMTLTPKGKMKEYSIVRSVINSRHRFTYEEAEDILDGKRHRLAEPLAQLWSLAQVLRKKRMKNGSIDFESTEAKFRYDATGIPIEVKIKHPLKSHKLIEEFMLLANTTVALHIGQAQPKTESRPFIYRIHDAPNSEKLAELALFVQKFGYSLNAHGSITSKDLQKLLNDVRGTKEENVINEVALRSMAKAVYSDVNIGHYGLAFDHYTHFTSPIRRYPDLLVHRLLTEYAQGMSAGRRHHFQKHLPSISRWCSDRERVATEAERDSVKVMQVEYMQRHVGDEFEGIISGVMQYGLFIELNDLLVEGMLHVRNIDDDFFLYDEKQYLLKGQRTHTTFRLGDTITVKVLSVNVERRFIDFGLAQKTLREGTSRHHESRKRKSR